MNQRPGNTQRTNSGPSNQRVGSGNSSQSRGINAAVANNNRNPNSVQSRLDEAGFAKYLDGFESVTADDLLEAKGGRVRYVIEDQRGNRKYRLGGWLAKVDPRLRYLRLFNPFAKKAWSVQLSPAGQRVYLYYMPPGTSDEVAMMRKLLQQLENGDITIAKI